VWRKALAAGRIAQLIAATALANELLPYTANVADFPGAPPVRSMARSSSRLSARVRPANAHRTAASVSSVSLAKYSAEWLVTRHSRGPSARGAHSGLSPMDAREISPSVIWAADRA